VLIIEGHNAQHYRQADDIMMPKRWQTFVGPSHWRRQLWGTGTRAPSTSTLWHSTVCGCLLGKRRYWPV